MTQAIRENRQGWICVDDGFASAEPEATALLCERMMLSDIEPDGYGRSRWRGYALEFDALPLGQKPPEYRAEFTIDAARNVTLKFTRREP